jgi:hypothetical protein
MALTGIQIFKLLPKTNCKECGVPTCLAFAMNLASGKAELESCPYVSDEAREQLAEASAPPIRPVRHRRSDRYLLARAFAPPPRGGKPFSTVMKKPFTIPPCWLLQSDPTLPIRILKPN